jgi:hypothetical protein
MAKKAFYVRTNAVVMASEASHRPSSIVCSRLSIVPTLFILFATPFHTLCTPPEPPFRFDGHGLFWENMERWLSVWRSRCEDHPWGAGIGLRFR